VSPDPGCTHSSMNGGKASCTGASLKIAPFSPTATSTWHVPTNCLITDSCENDVGGMLHDPDVQCASSIWLTAVRQSVTLIGSPLANTLPHTGVPKVTLPKFVGAGSAEDTEEVAGGAIEVG
jgi:hypothetical protein